MMANIAYKGIATNPAAHSARNQRTITAQQSSQLNSPLTTAEWLCTQA
jgi:hypothetical protein